jgi:hypothetical protein
MPDGNRRFTRVPFPVAAELRIGAAVYPDLEIIDLGVGGCRLAQKEGFAAGTACDIVIDLSGAEGSLKIAASGEVIRSGPDGTAVQFTAMDPDSLFHLKNVVRYNCADPDRLEDEFARHPGLK